MTFEGFERAYVKTHGQCKTKIELRRFFNLANALGLKKNKKVQVDWDIFWEEFTEHENKVRSAIERKVERFLENAMGAE